VVAASETELSSTPKARQGDVLAPGSRGLCRAKSTLSLCCRPMRAVGVSFRALLLGGKMGVGRAIRGGRSGRSSAAK